MSKVISGENLFKTYYHYSHFLINKLGRITTSGLYIPEMDGLRFLAISWVVLFHIQYFLSTQTIVADFSQNVVGKIIGVGDIGVELFFVISGFILALPFANRFVNQGKVVNIKNYFWRRLTRLEPPYILAMLTFYGLAILQSKHDVPTLIDHGLASIFYLHGFFYNSRSLINSVAWSLEIEVQFYILAPLVAQIFRLNKNIRRFLLCGLIILFPIFCDQFGWSYLSILGHAQFFLAGLLLVDFYLNKKALSHKLNWMLEMIGLVSLCLLSVFWYYRNLQAWTPWVIIVFYWSVLTGKLLHRVFASTWVRIFGGMCYSIYLIHNPIIAVIGYLSRRFLIADTYFLNLLIQGMIMIPVIMAAGIVFFILIEKPCMNKDWPRDLAIKLKTWFYRARLSFQNFD